MSPRVRCAIYTRKSSEEGLEQSFNSLHAQREACEAYILSQRHEGWQLIAGKYDDGGFSGGTMERPALKRLLEDIASKRIDTVVVYKVDRLTRALADFAKIVEQFDKQGVSFVSVTQQFNTTTSMGRLTLNVLLSFAQFEREVTGERIRDKIAASKRKGMWMGGVVPLGYELRDRQLSIQPEEAERVQQIFRAYLEQGCVSKLRTYLEEQGIRSKQRVSRNGRASGGVVFSRGALYQMLQNRIYLGEITHKDKSFPGQQPAILDQELWDRVQAQLKANLQGRRNRPRSTEKSLLAGLLYDGEGNHFTPTHANKRGKRYRYYCSRAVIKKGGGKAAGPARVPAQEIEDLILAELNRLFQSPQQLLALLSEPATDESSRQRLLESIQIPRELKESSNIVLRALLDRVLVHEDRVELQVRKGALLKLVLGQDRDIQADDSEDNSLGHITLPLEAQLKRCGGEVRFLLPPDSAHAKPHPVPALVRAVARAHDWLAQIMRGDVSNQRAIAAATGLDERYISRVLPLAFLAPDLTEAILEGKQSSTLDLGRCLKPLPPDWKEQRVSLRHG
jgi:DNA invertase Pin-like site-specific DNA recombinase